MKLTFILLIFLLSCTKKSENIFVKPDQPQQGGRFGASGEDEPTEHRLFMIIWNGDILVSEHFSDGCVLFYDTIPVIKLSNSIDISKLKLSWPE